MANEEFGLGFTTQDVALWTEDGLGPSSNLFIGDIVTLENAGSPANIFANLTLLENVSSATILNTTGICEKPNALGIGGPYSTLSGPGSPNVLSCP